MALMQRDRGFTPWDRWSPMRRRATDRIGPPATSAPHRVGTSDPTGFTLIELMVVIAIIGVLIASVVPATASLLAKSRDATRKSDLAAVSVALYAFYEQNQRMPANYHPGTGACEGDGYYAESMQELITALALKAMPKSPRGASYCYYNYGSGNTIGALLVTTMETARSTTGPNGSCRPWAAGANWCSVSDNNFFCLCNPY